jgi:hypothetical protein
VTLQVFTSHISRPDPDLLNVSTKAARLGATFAPTLASTRRPRETNQDWDEFVAAYERRMRHMYVTQRSDWDELLSWQRVVLACSCDDATRCHRTVLAQHVLVKLGAEYGGELG